MNHYTSETQGHQVNGNKNLPQLKQHQLLLRLCSFFIPRELSPEEQQSIPNHTVRLKKCCEKPLKISEWWSRFSSQQCHPQIQSVSHRSCSRNWNSSGKCSANCLIALTWYHATIICLVLSNISWVLDVSIQMMMCKKHSSQIG